VRGEGRSRGGVCDEGEGDGGCGSWGGGRVGADVKADQAIESNGCGTSDASGLVSRDRGQGASFETDEADVGSMSGIEMDVSVG